MSPTSPLEEIPTATSFLDSTSVSHPFPSFLMSLGKHLDTQGKFLARVTPHLFWEKGCLLKPERSLKPLGTQAFGICWHGSS